MKITKLQIVLISIILARVLLYDIYKLNYAIFHNKIWMDYTDYFCDELAICCGLALGATFIKGYKHLYRAFLSVLIIEVVVTTKTLLFGVDYETLASGLRLVGFALVVSIIIKSIKVSELEWKH